MEIQITIDLARLGIIVSKWIADAGFPQVASGTVTPVIDGAGKMIGLRVTTVLPSVD